MRVGSAGRSTAELVVVVGVQGSGKSTWVREHLADTHVVVSKDHWPNARRREARQQRIVDELLAAGRDVVVDNTNPTPAERAPLVAIARLHGAAVRAVHVDAPVSVCLQRNAGRVGRALVPTVGVLATARRLVPPSPEEGFDRVDVVRMGTAARGSRTVGAGHASPSSDPGCGRSTIAGGELPDQDDQPGESGEPGTVEPPDRADRATT